MDNFLFLLKLPNDDAACKSGSDKVFVLLAHNNVCDVVFVSCQLFVTEQDFALKVIKASFKLAPTKYKILVL